MDSKIKNLGKTFIRRSSVQGGTEKYLLDKLYQDLKQENLSFVLLFVSPKFASEFFAKKIKEYFPDVPVIGCTTAGEITPKGYEHDSVTGISFAAPEFYAAVRGIPDVTNFSVSDGRELVHGCLQDLKAKQPDLTMDRIFGMLLIDGLDACEETVVSAVYRELGQIPLFGGSAGDELSFADTKVLWGGAFSNHSAALALIATDRPFRVFKTEHFGNSEKKMVVTGADPLKRIVFEINAEPAAEEYARMIGVDIRQLTPMIFANYPVVVRVGDVPYVRSIQKVNDDGSLTFYCAIDEGIVLTVATGLDIELDLERLFASIREDIGEPEIIIGCDCILRNLELRKKGKLQGVSKLMAKNNVIGFNTYGEQYQAMHVNHTFTGVAIGRRN